MILLAVLVKLLWGFLDTLWYSTNNENELRTVISSTMYSHACSLLKNGVVVWQVVVRST